MSEKHKRKIPWAQKAMADLMAVNRSYESVAIQVAHTAINPDEIPVRITNALIVHRRNRISKGVSSA